MKTKISIALLSLFLAGNAHAVTVQATDTYNGHTYYLLSDSTWLAANSAALSLGGTLVSIGDAAENTWLNSTAFGGAGQNMSFWIGLTHSVLDDGASPFAWLSGEPLSYTNWSAGEPNFASDVFGENENYVHTYLDGTWNDLASSSGYYGLKYGVVEVVPEPETLALTLAGLALTGMRLRKRV